MATFQFPESKRELLTNERAEELARPLRECIEQKDSGRFSKIVISGKSFGRDAALVFANYISQLKDVTVADFNDIIAGRPTDEALEVLEILCSSLEHFQLDELNLSNNAVGVRGVPAIKKALHTQAKLRKLYFNNDGLQGEAVTKIAEYVLAPHEDKKSKLETFEIFNNLLQDAGAKALAPLLEASPLLKHVRVATTRISKAGGLAICKAVSELRNLEHVDFDDNTFGVEAGVTLAAGLLSNAPQLRSLNLADTGLDEKGITAVIKALHNTAPLLEYLNLSNNEISPSMASLLTPIVKEKKGLKTLILEGNELKSKGVITLSTALIGQEALEELNLAENQITSKAADDLVACLKTLKSLKKLSLNDNLLNDESTDRIRDVCDSLGMTKEAVNVEDQMEEDDEEEEDEDVDELADELSKESL